MPPTTVTPTRSLRRAGLALALIVTVLAPTQAALEFAGQDGPRRSLQDLLCSAPDTVLRFKNAVHQQQILFTTLQVIVKETKDLKA